jgi:hypothetical protein
MRARGVWDIQYYNICSPINIGNPWITPWLLISLVILENFILYLIYLSKGTYLTGIIGHDVHTRSTRAISNDAGYHISYNNFISTINSPLNNTRQKDNNWHNNNIMFHVLSLKRWLFLWLLVCFASFRSDGVVPIWT